MPSVKTTDLEIHYFDNGPRDGWPVVLSHGFPYDPHAFDEVVPMLVNAGARVLVPYLRGFGPTRFLSEHSMRTGQQSALGRDLIGFLDALSIDRAIVAGFDWGGVASCTATALFPERILGLVSYASYDVVDVQSQKQPVNPGLECVMWYQHLLQTERGRECLRLYRRDFCEILWRQWSPNWNFPKSAFDLTAPSFDNPDFVDIVTHTYRFVFGLTSGDPALDDFEARLAQKPKIVVPAITIDGLDDPLKPGGTASHASMFVGRHEHRSVACGHNMPQEAPKAFADAILMVRKWLEEES